MAKTIAVLNFKGGVGKTTTAVNLADALRGYGKSCLVIDLDSQCSSTIILDSDKSVTSADTIYESMKEKTLSPLTIFEHSKGLDFVASDIRMGDIDELLVGRTSKEHILEKLIKSSKEEYDYIIIDCPPNRGVTTINAMVCSDSVLIPINSQYMALDGLSQITAKIAEIKDDDYLNPNLQIEGFLLTRYNDRTNIAKETRSALKAKFPGQVFNAVIHENTKVSEAPGYRQTVLEYEPTCIGSLDYLQLAREIGKLKPNAKWKKA